MSNEPFNNESIDPNSDEGKAIQEHVKQFQMFFPNVAHPNIVTLTTNEGPEDIFMLCVEDVGAGVGLNVMLPIDVAEAMFRASIKVIEEWHRKRAN